MFDLKAVQSALQEFGLDGWLLYDFRGLNVLATRVLEFRRGCHVFTAIPVLGSLPRESLAQAGASHRGLRAGPSAG